MARDEDEIITQIDTSHLSDDFADIVTQMVQDHLQNPDTVQIPPNLDIYSKENSISPVIKKSKLRVLRVLRVLIHGKMKMINYVSKALHIRKIRQISLMGMT